MISCLTHTKFHLCIHNPGGWRQGGASPLHEAGHIGHGPPLPKLHFMAIKPSKTVFAMSTMTVWKHLILSASPYPHVLCHLMDTETGQGLSEVSDCTSQDQPKICHHSPHFRSFHQAFTAKLRITYKKYRIQDIYANQVPYLMFQL